MVLAGGEGSRLAPLTAERSKPAVPFAGRYRIVDFVLSNLVNSGIYAIYLLVQYKSQSLIEHIDRAWTMSHSLPNHFITVVPPQMRGGPEWFQGTADAVRQSMRHLTSHRSREVLILSGDQLYQMDYRRMLDTHRRHVADATVAVLPVTAEQTAGFGILKVNRQGRIVHFEEKPRPERLPELESEIPGYGRGFLASMGIYMFSHEGLDRAISDPALVDFGRHVIPKTIGEQRVQAHFFRGYWEDVGTIRSYYEANLQLCDPMPPFDFYDVARPVYTHPRFLPASKVEGCTLKSALVSEGGILMGAEIERSVIGIRSRIGQGTRIRHSLILGAEYYESLEEIDRAQARGLPPVGIGPDSVIEHAIVDMNSRVGRGVRIVNEEGAQEKDAPGYYIRDGIVIVPKGGVIADGAVI
jgi:glucose-1-phosphate adenylyltransferase